MKKIIFVLFGILVFVSLVCVSASKEDVFVLRLNYDKGNVFVDDLIVSKGYFNEDAYNEGKYLLKMISLDEELLYSQNFEFDLEVYFEPNPDWFDEDGNQIVIPDEETVVKDTAELDLILPYYKNAQRIEISESGKLILNYEIIPSEETIEEIIEERNYVVSEEESEEDLDEFVYDESDDVSVDNDYVFYLIFSIILILIIFIVALISWRSKK